MRYFKEACISCVEFRSALRETDYYTNAPKIKKFAVEFLYGGIAIGEVLSGVLKDVEGLIHIWIAKILMGAH